MKARILNASLLFLFASNIGCALADHPAVAFGGEGTGAINTISTMPLPQGAWALGIRSETIDSDPFSTEQLEDFAADGREGVHSVDSVSSTSVSVSYGVTDDLSVSARLPHVSRKNIRESELEGGNPEAHTHGDSSGLGDLLLLGQYRVSSEASNDVSLLFGVKAPTGDTDVTDNDGARFETEFQPGTGSWDGLFGVSISSTTGQLRYHASFLYNLTSEGDQDTRLGNVASYGIALTYRLGGSEHADHDHTHDHGAGESSLKWDVSVELNGETRDKTKTAGVQDENSGGTTVFVSPGLRVTAGSFSGFISYGIPVVEDHNGIQTDIKKRIMLGLSLAL